MINKQKILKIVKSIKNEYNKELLEFYINQLTKEDLLYYIKTTQPFNLKEYLISWFKWQFGYYKCYLKDNKCYLKAGFKYYYYNVYDKTFKECIKDSSNTTSVYDLRKSKSYSNFESDIEICKDVFENFKKSHILSRIERKKIKIK
jgi:hypothetical protein